MGLAHLPFRDDPDRLLKVDLSPFHLAEFTGTLEHMRRKFQSIHDGRIALIILDRPEQRAERHRIGNGCEMLDPRRCQDAQQQLGRVRLASRGCDRIAKHAAGEGAQLLGAFQPSPPFVLKQLVKPFLRRDVCNRALAKSLLSSRRSQRCFPTGWREAFPALLLDQFLGDGCEAVARTNAGLDPGLPLCCAGIDGKSQLPAGSITGGTASANVISG